MKTLYWFYRKERLNSPYKLWNTSLNGNYSMSFFLANQYADYLEAWLISINDNLWEDRYTKELAPWIKDLREFVSFSYNDTYVSDELINTIIWKVCNRFDLFLLTAEEAKTFLKEHTDLIEESDGKFLVNEADEMREANYITII